MGTSESRVEQLLDRLVRSDLGGLTEKLSPTRAGIPDRLVLLPGGRVVFVELKAAGGRLRPVQQLWLSRAASLGAETVVLTGTAEVRQWISDQRS